MGMKSITQFTLLLLLLVFALQAKADDTVTTSAYFERAGLKLTSGFANVLTGWMELPKNIGMWQRKTDDGITATSEGVLRGLVHTASRTASGVIDVVTFWLPTFPTPSPPFIWEDYSVESKYHAFRTGG